MNNSDLLLVDEIVDSVKSGRTTGLKTNAVPDVKDIMSAHIILRKEVSMRDFGDKFPNTFKWVSRLRASHENWSNVLEDFLFLTQEGEC